MNNDAISRSAALDIINEERRFAESLREIIEDNEDRAHNTGELACAIGLARKIKALPALDVAPVIHATWIEDGYRGIPCVCSHCGEEAHYKSTFVEQYGYDWNENLVLCGYSESKEYIRSKCCPECGARMDGDVDATD